MTPPGWSAAPSKHPPCSCMSCLTRIGMPSCLPGRASQHASPGGDTTSFFTASHGLTRPSADGFLPERLRHVLAQRGGLLEPSLRQRGVGVAVGVHQRRHQQRVVRALRVAHHAARRIAAFDEEGASGRWFTRLERVRRARTGSTGPTPSTASAGPALAGLVRVPRTRRRREGCS